MMKRAGGIRPMSAAAAENYEHMLMCLICRSLFDDHDHQPKFLPCHHTFCKECLREYVRQMGDDIECPSCRKVATIPAAGVAALQTNFYAKYIQTLVYGTGAIGINSDARSCEKHPSYLLKYYCEDCVVTMCDMCVEQSDCTAHRRSPIAAVAERFRQGIDTAFTGASTVITRKKAELEGRLRVLSDEKDRALLRIDAAFESHAHTLARRATLLKNKVIDIYNENSGGLESGLEDVDTAMTCIVSLREYYEAAISKDDFEPVAAGRGTAEIDEVAQNIIDRVRPPEIHIVFDGDHGADKFRACTKDLGRVLCNRCTVKHMDSTPEEEQPPIASGGLDSLPQTPDFNVLQNVGDFGKVPDVSKLASGDGSASQLMSRSFKSDLPVGDPVHNSSTIDSAVAGDSFMDREKVQEFGSGDGSSLPKQRSGSSLENHTAGAVPLGRDGQVLGASPKTGQTSKVFPSASNNNYYTTASCTSRGLPTDLNQLGISAVMPDKIDNLAPHRRSCASYDEDHLRRELSGDLLGDPVDTLSQCMSRSEYWTLGATVDPSLSDEECRAAVVAELSGEQTAL